MAEPTYLLYPNAKWEGCLTAACQGDDAVKRTQTLEQAPQLQKFRVRATLTDVIPLTGELDDLLGLRPFKSIKLNEDPLEIYLHHGAIGGR